MELQRVVEMGGIETEPQNHAEKSGCENRGTAVVPLGERLESLREDGGHSGRRVCTLTAAHVPTGTNQGPIWR